MNLGVGRPCRREPSSEPSQHQPVSFKRPSVFCSNNFSYAVVGLAPACSSSAASRNVPGVVLLWRNQPVSIARATNKAMRRRRRRRRSQGRDRFINQPARRFRRGIDEPRAAEIVLRHMMVDDQLRHVKRLEEGAEVAELVPGSGVEHNGGVGVAVVVAGRRERANTLRRIEETRSAAASCWRRSYERFCPALRGYRRGRAWNPGRLRRDGRASSARKRRRCTPDRRRETNQAA